MPIYYVDHTRADNSGDGLSWAAAKRDIWAAVNLSTAGDAIWVGSNTTHFVTGAVSFAGITTNNSSGITLQGRNPSDNSIAFADINLSGLAIAFASNMVDNLHFHKLRIFNNGATNIFSAGGASYHRIVDCIFASGTSNGVVLGPRCFIVNTTIHSFSGIGLFQSSSTYAWIKGCTIYNCTDDAMRIGATDTVVEFNYIDAIDDGIAVQNIGCLINNNTIKGSSIVGKIGITFSNLADRGTCFGNIIDSWQTGVSFTTPGVNLIGYNNFFNCGINELSQRPSGFLDLQNDLGLNPNYVNITGNNFAIQNTGLYENNLIPSFHYGANQSGSIAEAEEVVRGIFRHPGMGGNIGA